MKDKIELLIVNRQWPCGFVDCAFANEPVVERDGKRMATVYGQEVEVNRFNHVSVKYDPQKDQE